MTTQALERTKKPATRKRMVRKQVYIHRWQDEQLKHLAQQRETTEAELIRQTIEVMLNQPVPITTAKSLPPDEEAWQALLKSMREHRAKGIPGEPHRWTREAYYDDERSKRLYGSSE